MEGGTTSGVVYPLAVCELATNFRFRNVGGASAGAIAAALTAAAELGRSSEVLASGGLSRHESKRKDPVLQTNGLQIRQGFTGMADIISWLAQTQPGDQEADEYRPRLFTLALIFGAVVLAGYLEWKFTGAPRTIPEIIGLGFLGVLAYIATLVGLALILQGVRSGLRKPPTQEGATPRRLEQLRLYTSAYATPRSTTVRQLVIGVVLIIPVIVFAFFRPALYASAVLVGLAASIVVTVGLLTSILIYVNRFRSRAFGFVPGTTPQRERNLLDLMAGVPKPTVEKSLVPWLNDCLNALAGLPVDQVLRFGHLWSGLDYHEQRLQKSSDGLAEWQLMSTDPDRRLVKSRAHDH